MNQLKEYCNCAFVMDIPDDFLKHQRCDYRRKMFQLGFENLLAYKKWERTQATNKSEGKPYCDCWTPPGGTHLADCPMNQWKFASEDVYWKRSPFWEILVLWFLGAAITLSIVLLVAFAVG